MLTEIQPVEDKAHKGGGLWGSIAGAITGAAAAIAAPVTGGASLAAIPAAASLGMAAGGAIGEAVDPSKAPEMSGHVPQVPTQNNMPLRTMEMHPEVQMAAIQDSKQALRDAGNLSADQHSQYLNLFNQAQQKLKSQIGIG